MTPDSPEEQATAKMLKCSHCPKEFKYNSERNRHELSHSPRFECEVCCKKFSFVSALRRHQKQHERTGSVKCKECNRKFRDEVLLKRHMKYAHKGTFTCSKCNAQFSSDQALSTHMKTHKPESERRFKCSFEACGKSFNFSHHLKHHELTHTNAKQHYCNVCGKGFIQSHHLNTHLKTHDPSEWLYCEVTRCKKKFSTEYARKRHMATHKIKPDSGISSDSNSCDASISSKECVEDLILCASCGESVLHNDYQKHSSECEERTFDPHNFRSCPSPVKQEIRVEEPLDASKHMLDKYLGGCQSAVGDCIMNANNCVCAQMSKPNDGNYDFSPFGNPDSITNEINNNINLKNEYYENQFENFKMDSNTEVSMYDGKDNETVPNRIDSVDIINERSNIDTYFSYDNSQNSVINKCEGCACASSCNMKDPSNCNLNTKRDFVSNVELRIDGIIKIKNTFDIDIPIKVETKEIQEPQPFVPFSTCKDVIGNCIVGGNEGCLCARMMMIDDQQAMAQEIDDITPKPKTELLNML